MRIYSRIISSGTKRWRGVEKGEHGDWLLRVDREDSRAI